MENFYEQVSSSKPGHKFRGGQIVPTVLLDLNKWSSNIRLRKYVIQRRSM